MAPSFDSARKQPRKHGNLAIPLPRIVAKAPFTLTSTYFSGSTNLGVSLLDLLCGRQAVHNRHPHVHEDQIRPGTRAHRECLPSVGRLTNDLDVRLSESMFWRLSLVSSWSSTIARRVGSPTSSGEISAPTSLYTPDEQLADHSHGGRPISAAARFSHGSGVMPFASEGWSPQWRYRPPGGSLSRARHQACRPALSFPQYRPARRACSPTFRVRPGRTHARSP